MKKGFFLILLAIIFFSGYLLISCNKKSSECTSCEPLQENARIKINVGKATLETKIWYSNDNNAYQFASNTTTADQSDLREFRKSYLQELNVKETNPIDVGVVLYLNRFITNENNSVLQEDILGYSEYYIVNEKMYHRLFIKKDGKYFMVNELTTEVSSVSSGPINDIANNIFLNGNKNITSFVITDNEKLNIKLKRTEDNLEARIADYIKVLYPNSSFRPNEGGGKCPAPCPRNQKHDRCEKNASNIWSCEDTVESCSLTSQQADAELIVDSLTADSVFDLPNLYDFRDSFLINYSVIGQKYIDYYYSMSEFSNISNALLLETMSNLPAINQKAWMLIDAPNHLNDIVIDSTFKNNILTLIDHYIAATSNQSTINKLNDIKADINTYHNLTVSQILALIQ